MQDTIELPTREEVHPTTVEAATDVLNRLDAAVDEAVAEDKVQRGHSGVRIHTLLNSLHHHLEQHPDIATEDVRRLLGEVARKLLHDIFAVPVDEPR